ncbi:MAG: signal recognition particle protein [Armatimonadetes bacterium]|nr:signal recognition particle protein [Armatimonadota bacterium]
MFDSLSDKLQSVFDKLRGRGTLSEKDVDEALHEVRMALLEADVNFKIAKQFVAAIRDKAVGEETLKSLTPGQQVVKIVHDELVELLGGEPLPINWASDGPTTFMLCGLQGSGKTTTAAKLALWARSQGKRPLMAACDVKRPAAVAQLQALGKQLNIPVHSVEGGSAVDAAASAIEAARAAHCDLIILDTAGRLQIDDDLMAEAEEIKRKTRPNETFLVLDATTGQEAVNVAKAFDERVGIDGAIITKLDGDARGGAALSMRAVTGKPIRFIGIGERPDALEQFHADRMAGRILGMGDIMTLIEKAQADSDIEEEKLLQRKLRDASLDFEDFLAQMKKIRNMGPFDQLLKLIPGYSQMRKQLAGFEPDENQLQRMEAIVLSMTRYERKHPEALNFSRKKRVAKGSGTKIEEVNELVKRFMEMRQMMKQFNKMQSLVKKRRR